MGNETDLRETWKRLEAWIDANLPELRSNLHPGADRASLDRAEDEIGYALPEAVRESFLIHDGQDERGSVTGILFGLDLLSLEDALVQWRNWKSIEPQFADDEDANEGCGSTPEGAIRHMYTFSGWFPLTHDSGGNHIGVDLDPGPSGTYGQVITFGADEEHKYVVAQDWSKFLSDVAEELEAGNYEIDENRSLGMKDPPLHYHDALKKLLKRQGE